MATALKLVPSESRVNLDDLLTPDELAEKLKVKKSWVFEQTRSRAKIRNKRPLPCIRMGKYLLFSRIEVERWLANQSS